MGRSAIGVDKPVGRIDEFDEAICAFGAAGEKLGRGLLRSPNLLAMYVLGSEVGDVGGAIRTKHCG
jgi:hypothetical protein